jgi:hypothetical protein
MLIYATARVPVVRGGKKTNTTSISKYLPRLTFYVNFDHLFLFKKIKVIKKSNII